LLVGRTWKTEGDRTLVYNRKNCARRRNKTERESGEIEEEKEGIEKLTKARAEKKEKETKQKRKLKKKQKQKGERIARPDFPSEERERERERERDRERAFKR
jgi:hypothetical protein